MAHNRQRPPERVIEDVGRHLGGDRGCPWETALRIHGVSRAEDARWRDAVDAADEQGTEPPDREARWHALWRLSRDVAADVAGNLTRIARTGKGAEAVAAARAVLPVEVAEAWGEGSAGGPAAAADDEGLDEVAIGRLSPEQRKRFAEIGALARDMIAELEAGLREARGR